MKKTLVALVALAGTTFGLDTLTLGNALAAFTVSNGSITSTAGEAITLTGNTLTLTEGGNWGIDVSTDRSRTEITIAMNFDMSKLQSLTGATKLIQLGTNWGFGVMPDEQEGVRFTGVWGNNNPYVPSGRAPFKTDALTTTQGTLSIVATLDNAGTRIYVGNEKTYYTCTDLKGGCNSSNLTISDLGLAALTDVVIWQDDTYAITTAGQAKTSSAFTALAQVPEPATATLSLLALAGLASRRKRH